MLTTTMVWCVSCTAPERARVDRAGDDQLLAAFERAVEARAKAGQFSGVVLVARAGKVELEPPIGTWLPDYPNREVATRVTVRHLLTHTGGTGDIFGPDFAKGAELREHADYLRQFGSRGLAFEPGSSREYSNYGFILLGAIIERVSGEPYDTYVSRHVFAPAGMTGTDSRPESVAASERAVGYTRQAPDGPWESTTQHLPWKGNAAGGGSSTVRDLWRFAQALQTERLLPAALIAEATKLQVPPDPRLPGEGLGFTLLGSGRARWFGHGGGAPGMNATLRIYPEAQTVLVILSNLDPPSADELGDVFEEHLAPGQPRRVRRFGPPPPLAPPAATKG